MSVPPPPAASRSFLRDVLGGRDPYDAGVAITRTAIQAVLAAGLAILVTGEAVPAAMTAAVALVLSAAQNLFLD